MSLNASLNNIFPETIENKYGVLELSNPDLVRTESLENKKSKSKLDIIYIGEKIIINLISDENKSFIGFDLKTVKRIKQAWEWEAADELIACVDISPNVLSIMGCDFQDWEIPFESLPCFDNISDDDRANFELDEDGSYLYWECADLHLDLESFKAVVDSEFKAKLLCKKEKYNKSFGKAIKLLRKEYKLNQKDIKSISDRHIRRIEKGTSQVTLDILKKLATSHKLDLESYLEKVNEKLN